MFEPEEDEKNEDEYKKIHDDYKNLVSILTTSVLNHLAALSILDPLNIILQEFILLIFYLLWQSNQSYL